MEHDIKVRTLLSELTENATYYESFYDFLTAKAEEAVGRNFQITDYEIVEHEANAIHFRIQGHEE